jgi:hypothetical protein
LSIDEGRSVDMDEVLDGPGGGHHG